MPLFFATSHLHASFLDYSKGEVPIKRAVLIGLFKLAYTEVFGIYSGLVYVRTGSIWPAILLHSYCNYFGFPHFLVLISNKFRLTDRIIPGILYVLGLIIVYYSFDTIVPDLSPWW
jgi:prenyl protein peptidase